MSKVKGKGVEDNILSMEQWLRILLMIAFGVLSWILRFLQIIVAVIQALFALVTGRDNLNIRRVGTVLSLYQAHIWLYLSYGTDAKPFPFNDLPQSADDLIVEPPAYPETDEAPQDVGETSGQQSQGDDVFSDISFTAQDTRPEPNDEPEQNKPVLKPDMDEGTDSSPTSGSTPDEKAPDEEEKNS